MKRLMLTLLCLITNLTTLTICAQDRDWVGAEISTRDAFRYGRMEFSMRAVNRSGVLANFFTYKTNSELTPSNRSSAATINNYEWEEIDLEIFGQDNADHYESNIIYEVDSNSRVDNHAEEHDNKSSYASSLTEFRIDWRPRSIRWFEKINGSYVMVRDISTANNSTASEITGLEEMDSPHTFRFNIWSSTNVGFAGPFTASDQSSQEAIIDYFRYYPLGANGQISSTATINDNFSGNRLNESIWNIAGYTFEGNRARFVRSSVRVSGGRLRLKFGPGFTERNDEDPFDNSAKHLDNGKKASQLRVYPNPIGTQNTLNIVTHSKTGGTLTLHDVNGKVIYSKTFKANTTQINIKSLHLNKGIYILKVKTNAQVHNTKLVI